MGSRGRWFIFSPDQLFVMFNKLKGHIATAEKLTGVDIDQDGKVAGAPVAGTAVTGVTSTVTGAQATAQATVNDANATAESKVTGAQATAVDAGVAVADLATNI